MEHITFFIFILLLQKSSNNRLFPLRIPVTAKYQDISYSLNPNSAIQRGRVLTITPKSFKQIKQDGRFIKPSLAIRKELMEFTPPAFKIPYAVTPVKNAKNPWMNIPYSSPENYTQLKKINYHLKSKRLTADESKNDERKKDENRRIEEEMRFSEQRKLVDAKKKLEMLERELEIKKELGTAELEPNREVVIPKTETKEWQALSAKDLIPKIETKLMQPLSAKDEILETLKIQSPMFAKENETNRKPQSDKSDSSSEELSVNWHDDDKISLYYDLDADHALRVKLE